MIVEYCELWMCHAPWMHQILKYLRMHHNDVCNEWVSKGMRYERITLWMCTWMQTNAHITECNECFRMYIHCSVYIMQCSQNASHANAEIHEWCILWMLAEWSLNATQPNALQMHLLCECAVNAVTSECMPLRNAGKCRRWMWTKCCAPIMRLNVLWRMLPNVADRWMREIRMHLNDGITAFNALECTRKFGMHAECGCKETTRIL